MRCAWEPVLAVLPPELKACVKPEYREDLQEIRLRLGKPPELNWGSKVLYAPGTVTRDMLNRCVNAASRYSPWQAQTVAQGYLTIAGGHRIGLCGQAVVDEGHIKGLRQVDSLCIRIARDVQDIRAVYKDLPGSVLIIGPPGFGKTTLLRDLSRQLSEDRKVVVLDERGELFPEGFRRGKRMDVLSLCPKAEGIYMALKTMGPEIIAVDEITEVSDCQALLHAANCGVRLLATAHASSLEDLKRRPVYRQLLEQTVFPNILTLHREFSCTLERRQPWN